MPLHTPVGMRPLLGRRNRCRDQRRAWHGSYRRASPNTVVDIRAVLDDMRLIRDSHEITLMRRAAEISSLAHARAMKHARPGQY